MKFSVSIEPEVLALIAILIGGVTLLVLWRKIMRNTLCKLKGHHFVFESRGSSAVWFSGVLIQKCSRCAEQNVVPVWVAV